MIYICQKYKNLIIPKPRPWQPLGGFCRTLAGSSFGCYRSNRTYCCGNGSQVSVISVISNSEKKVCLKILLAKRTVARFVLLVSTSKQSTFGGLISAKLGQLITKPRKQVFHQVTNLFVTVSEIPANVLRNPSIGREFMGDYPLDMVGEPIIGVGGHCLCPLTPVNYVLI
jgi:hypothetical protein